MQVVQGISTDYSRDKFSIGLDETDLSRLMTQYEIFPEQFTTETAYLLLTLEAERFVLVQSPKFGRPVETVQTQIIANREQFAKVVASLTGRDLEEMRKRCGLAPAELKP